MFIPRYVVSTYIKIHHINDHQESRSIRSIRASMSSHQGELMRFDPFQALDAGCGSTPDAGVHMVYIGKAWPETPPQTIP